MYVNFLKTLMSLMLIAMLAACGGGGGSAGTTSTGSSTSTGTTTGTVTAASAVSVSIGTDGTINAEAVDALKYSKKFVVTVVDQLGRPVLGAVVSPRIEMAGFGKGWTERDADFKELNDYRVYCPAEDLNNNDVLDSGEDRNGDGMLTPPRSTVTIVPTNGVYTTDATGSVVFELQYPKNYATWIIPTLVVTASVTGTEGSARMDYAAGYLAGDEKTASTPFVYSPFSTTLTKTPSCTDNY